MGQRTSHESLIAETAATLQRSAGDPECIRAAVFLFLNRAYEAGIEPNVICDLLGVSPDNVLQRAQLARADEAAVLAAYEILDPMLSQQYTKPDGAPE
jgi:hypothetical protein